MILASLPCKLHWWCLQCFRGCQRGCWIPLHSWRGIVGSQRHGKSKLTSLSSHRLHPLSRSPHLRSPICWSIEQWTAVWRESIVCSRKISLCAQNRTSWHRCTVHSAAHILLPPPPRGLTVSGLNLPQGNHSLWHLSHTGYPRVPLLELSPLWGLRMTDITG